MSIEALKKSIDDLVAANTLSGDGLRVVARLNEQFESAKAEVQKLREAYGYSDKRAAELNAELLQANLTVKLMADREESISKRERALFEIEKNLAVAQAKAEVYKEVTALVFRNTEIRRDMMGTTVPSASANPSYYPPASVPINESTTTKAE